MTLPLQGVKVLDFSRLLPGPFCSMMLADFGAEVLQVEEPSVSIQPSGRRTGQSRAAVSKSSSSDVESRAYDRVNCNKQRIILNLKHPIGQDIARKLAARSDVVLTEFRPGVTKRLGIDYETIVTLNPRIVYCEISLYGQNGPYINHPGHDPIAQSVSGIVAMVGDEDCPRNYAGLPLIDISSGLHAVIGILLALRARDLTGKGQYVDISMLDAALDFQVRVSQLLFSGKRVPRINKHNPSSGVWQCKDGKWLCTTNVEPHHWANFCRAIGREDLIPHQFNRERRQEMYEEVKRIFLSRTREEWLKTFWEGEFESQAAVVNEIDEVFDDPQVKARQMVVERDHPQVGTVKQMGISVKLRQTPGVIRGFSPLPGEHTREVLTSLGYSLTDIETLVTEGAVA